MIDLRALYRSLTQGAPEWRLARLGKVTASRIADVTAQTKTGWGASRANYMTELLIEHLTLEPTNGFKSAAMQYGTDTEPEARMEYQIKTGFDVEQIGFILHPTLAWAGASPDGLIGDNGLVEIKCPDTATHIETLLSGTIPGKYKKQIQFQLACDGRQWCDYVSYDKRVPPRMRLFIKRVVRDDEVIAYLEKNAEQFLAELSIKLRDLKGLCPESEERQ